MGGADRRVAICRKGSDVTVIATVPEWVGDQRTVRRCVAGTITPTGYVQACRLTDAATAPTDRTPVAAAIAELGPFDSVEEYPALFGHVVLDCVYLLVATATERCVELPFGRAIHAVKATKWVPVRLHGVPPPRATRKDRQRLDHFLATTFDDGYYWSDDVNVSTLFPHRPNGGSALGIAAHDPSRCDWGVAMRAPYAAAGVEAACSALIRGFARGVRLAAGDDGSPVWVHMLGRQNRLNPGPRYFGRGLNEQGQAGNDHVYELVVWRYDDAGPEHTQKKVRFARHVYLRGTVPLRFKSKLSTSGIGEAAIIIADDVYDGAPEYIARQVRLLDALHTDNCAGTTPTDVVLQALCDAVSGRPGCTLECLNLLKSVSAAGEDNLTRHFAIALERANDLLLGRAPAAPSTRTADAQSTATASAAAPDDGEHSVPNDSIAGGPLPSDAGSTTAAPEVDATMCASTAIPGSPPAASLIPQQPSSEPPSSGRGPPPLRLVNVDWLGLQRDFGTPGACCAVWDNTLDYLGVSPVSAGTFTLADPTDGDGTGFAVDQVLRQRRFVRANCADSLDRTNVAMFFTVAKLFTVIVASAGVDPSSVLATGRSVSDLAAAPASSPRSTAPAPAPSAETDGAAASSQPDFEARFNALVDETPPPLMRALVELFVANGDCVAQLYTSTGALHTSVMRQLAPGMKEAPSNGIISAQRRYENMFRDKKKRRVLEAMLNVRMPLHFPSFQGTFGLMPLAHELWPCALVVMGLDAAKAVKPETITVALQAHWVDIQAREGVEFATNRLSSELPVRIGVDPSSVANPAAAAARATAVSPSGSARPTTPSSDTRSESPAMETRDGAVASAGAGAKDDEELGDGAEIDTADRTAPARELMAVVVMPSADIARELLMRGALPVRYGDGTEGFASLHAYEYTVETRDLIATASPVGRVVSAASSLKRKFLRLIN